MVIFSKLGYLYDSFMYKLKGYIPQWLCYDYCQIGDVLCTRSGDECIDCPIMIEFDRHCNEAAELQRALLVETNEEDDYTDEEIASHRA